MSKTENTYTALMDLRNHKVHIVKLITASQATPGCLIVRGEDIVNGDSFTGPEHVDAAIEDTGDRIWLLADPEGERIEMSNLPDRVLYDLGPCAGNLAEEQAAAAECGEEIGPRLAGWIAFTKLNPCK